MREGFLQSSVQRTTVSPVLFNLNSISVKYNNILGLDNINLSLNSGEIYFVTGKSGAGKSTFLKVLAQDIKPTSGKLLSSTKGKFVAQVFQDLKLFEQLSIEENLWYAFDKSVYKTKNEFYKDMLELAGVLGLRDKLSLKLRDANGGLRQSTAMLRALLSRPDVLLADEPSASLDNESAVKLFELLNFYNVRKKMTIIWASHNRELVKQFPGKVIHLESGKLIYSGHACFI